MNPVTLQSTTGPQYAPPAGSAKKNELDFETFLRLLTVQLSTQNPLEPMNDRDFFAQMAQLGTVRGMDDLKAATQMTQASNLIGKTVTAVRPMTDGGSGGQNSLVNGKVERVTVRNGEIVVGIREQNGGVAEVKLDNISEVTA